MAKTYSNLCSLTTKADLFRQARGQRRCQACGFPSGCVQRAGPKDLLLQGFYFDWVEMGLL